MLSGMNAVVTGGSSGIGAAVCVALAREGARVVVVASHDRGKAEPVVERIVAGGGQAQALAADVTDRSEIDALFSEVREQLGGLDILVNAAGVYYKTPIDATCPAALDRMIDINLRGTWNCISAAVPLLKARGGGKIVNLASVAAYAGLPGYSLYCATKAAIVLMTRSLACELARFDINVNAIAPGNTETPMNEAFRSDPARRTSLEALARATPSRVSFSRPEEIAEAVVFIVTRGRPMHGSTLLMDEGVSAGMMF